MRSTRNTKSPDPTVVGRSSDDIRLRINRSPRIECRMPASKLRPAAITRNIFIFSPFLKQAYTGLAATCTRLTSGLTQEAARPNWLQTMVRSLLFRQGPIISATNSRTATDKIQKTPERIMIASGSLTSSREIRYCPFLGLPDCGFSCLFCFLRLRTQTRGAADRERGLDARESSELV